MGRSRLAVLIALGVVIGIGSPALAAKGGGSSCSPRRGCGTADTTAPQVAITSPSSGSSVPTAVSVSGVASDEASLSVVDVSVDNGAWQRASGTSSWTASLNLGSGTHSIAARATDAAGNSSLDTVTVSVAAPADTTAPSVTISSPASGATVSGTVAVAGSAADNAGISRVDVSVDGGAWQVASGTSSWTWSWGTAAVADGSHTLTARATDSSGNSRTTAVSVTVQNAAPAPSPTPTASPTPTTPPNTQGSWTSPEGMQIDVSSAGPWTIAQIYNIFKANAYQLDKLGPTLTVKVQDTYASQTASGAGTVNGVYANFSATIYLKGVSSTFASYPEAQATHEYGHAWTMYHYYVTQQANWTKYLNSRWSSADGSVTLASDSRTGTSYNWNQAEIIADDYRLLFGTPEALRTSHLNPYIVDPRQQPGLKNWLLTQWATAP